MQRIGHTLLWVTATQLALISTAIAAPVSLTTWTAESYPAVSGFPNGDWQVAGDAASVTQIQNGQPTVFFSDFSARNTTVTGTIEVQTTTDDDYIGFVLGFLPGDSVSAAADYLLIDWKQVTQAFDFTGPPGANATPGSTAMEGLAVSRVSGTPTADELWGHVDFVENPTGGVSELARATSLGATGWDDNTAYDFRFEYTETALQVFVDGTLELSIAGTFPDGRLGFYNFSQGDVRYSAFDVIPEPSTALLLCAGLAGLIARAGSRARPSRRTH